MVALVAFMTAFNLRSLKSVANFNTCNRRVAGSADRGDSGHGCLWRI